MGYAVKPKYTGSTPTELSKKFQKNILISPLAAVRDSDIPMVATGEEISCKVDERIRFSDSWGSLDK